MTLTDALLIALLVVVVAGGLFAAGATVDRKAPRGRRVAVTTTSGETFVGVLVHEDRHRLVLEDVALVTADSETPMTGRQHLRHAQVKWTQERGA